METYQQYTQYMVYAIMLAMVIIVVVFGAAIFNHTALLRGHDGTDIDSVLKATDRRIKLMAWLARITVVGLFVWVILSFILDGSGG